ncbi:dual specificity phosphatase [Drechmeria coniospora]|uniref:protein-tyrosine-phosphatase n=1 Tax=Drechmeria coniospora TaxID=98403 RepID=A0A151GB52_DRECN|nr:dual specificity phosphatase [Drechmeria coniospora]KYK54275.1 dual specificity phosphatase [Drechmeria coniospora]
MVGFDSSSVKNFKDEPWAEYGRGFRHLVVDIDDVDETNLLIELPRAVSFIDEGLNRCCQKDPGRQQGGGAVFVHCVAGKSRSVSATIAYLLWKCPDRFDPAGKRPRSETGKEAVDAALRLIRRTRPMAEPNDGFMEQLALWWAMGCPDDVESHPTYQRWVYRREVEESVAVGQAPSRLRFADEEKGNGKQEGRDDDVDVAGTAAAINLRCKKCRRTLATSRYIQAHNPAPRPHSLPQTSCPHHFVEPLSWMRAELEKGQLSGRLLCPNERCGAGVGRYDWKGIRCACGAWVTPALSLQRARVDEEVKRAPAAMRNAGETEAQAEAARRLAMGIRMPPGTGTGAGPGPGPGPGPGSGTRGGNL